MKLIMAIFHLFLSPTAITASHVGQKGPVLRTTPSASPFRNPLPALILLAGSLVLAAPPPDTTPQTSALSTPRIGAFLWSSASGSPMIQGSGAPSGAPSPQSGVRILDDVDIGELLLDQPVSAMTTQAAPVLAEGQGLLAIGDVAPATAEAAGLTLAMAPQGSAETGGSVPADDPGPGRGGRSWRSVDLGPWLDQALGVRLGPVSLDVPCRVGPLATCAVDAPEARRHFLALFALEPMARGGDPLVRLWEVSAPITATQALGERQILAILANGRYHVFTLEALQATAGGQWFRAQAGPGAIPPIRETAVRPHGGAWLAMGGHEQRLAVYDLNRGLEAPLGSMDTGAVMPPTRLRAPVMAWGGRTEPRKQASPA